MNTIFQSEISPNDVEAIRQLLVSEMGQGENWRSDGRTKKRKYKRMTKTIHCKRCIKVEGPTKGSHQASQRAGCPYCDTPNEIQWSMGAGYSASRCDGDELPK